MEHVLIVEVDRIFTELAEQALTGRYRITVAESAEKALGFLSDDQPELIMLASTLPDMEGLELLRTIINHPGMNEIPIIFINHVDENETIKKALKIGASDIITKPFSVEMIYKRTSMLLELQDYRKNSFDFIRYQDAISVSIAELVECRDVTTGGHLKNTTAYFRLLLEEIIHREEYKELIPEEDVRDLIRLAPLHDIGKIGINDDILRKASTLDYNEFEAMKTHTILGKDTFEKIMKETGETRFLQLARDLAFCHHEKWDGSGYPNGLKGEEIPFYARVLTIADVYDALTSQRTYKDAFPHKKAVDIICEGKGSFFDPDLVDIFLEINDRFEQALAIKYKNSASE